MNMIIAYNKSQGETLKIARSLDLNSFRSEKRDAQFENGWDSLFVGN